jgi:Pyridoxamine 5'-phosphate oxidase
VSLDDFRSLLDPPSPAALVTFGADGSADVSPVWFRCTDSAFEVVVAADDPKLRRLAIDDRAVLTIFETVPPFRGVKVAGRVTWESDPTVVREAREAIAPRYLGETRGSAFVEPWSRRSDPPTDRVGTGLGSGGGATRDGRPGDVAAHSRGVHGAQTIQQCLDAGLLDEVHVDLAAVLLGAGVRLFDHLANTPVVLGDPKVIAGVGVTHLR